MSSKPKGTRIEPKDFSMWMNTLLDWYGAEVASVTVQAADKASKEARDKLKSKSTGAFKDITGSYRRGWRATLRKTNTGVDARVYNLTDYRLTHLLEFGHQMRSGGRSKEFPHISTVNDWAIEQFEKYLWTGLEDRSKK